MVTLKAQAFKESFALHICVLCMWFNKMYVVVEFKSSADGGGLAIVHKKWLTPKKRECLWPDLKNQRTYHNVLSSAASPDECWKLYELERIFCECGKWIILIWLLFVLKNCLARARVSIPSLSRLLRHFFEKPCLYSRVSTHVLVNSGVIHVIDKTNRF